MRIRVSDIGRNGLEVNDTIPLKPLNDRMNEGKGNNIVFLTDPSVKMTVRQTASGAETRGSISARYSQPCAWCAENIERDLEVEANFIFQRMPDAPADGDSDEAENGRFMDDIGINFFSDDQIELDDLIQETLILALDPFWKPPLLDDGTCSICGKKVEVEREPAPGKVNLADLLKKAGVH